MAQAHSRGRFWPVTNRADLKLQRPVPTTPGELPRGYLSYHNSAYRVRDDHAFNSALGLDLGGLAGTWAIRVVM